MYTRCYGDDNRDNSPVWWQASGNQRGQFRRDRQALYTEECHIPNSCPGQTNGWHRGRVVPSSHVLSVVGNVPMQALYHPTTARVP